jgi:hypothetical protein
MNRIIYVLLIAVLFSCEDEIVKPTVTNPTPTANLPPVAIGGPDRTITLPDTTYTVLDGTRSYDPDGIKLALTWSQISGPNTAVFYDMYTKPGDALTVFSTSGRYLFQLTASDDKFTRSDTVEITVKWASDCNPARELVSAETDGVGFSPSMVGSGLSCAIGPDKLVLAGGAVAEPFWPDDPPTTYSSLFHIYDMKTNTWNTSEMFRAKGEMACVITGNKLYLGGGVTNDGKITDDVEIHDLVTRTAIRAKLSVPRSNLSVAAAVNKVVFAGGSDQNGNAIDAVDIYDLSTNSWSTAILSEPRRSLTAMVSGSKIYFVGGSLSYGTGYSNAVDIYDATTDSWTVRRINRQGSHFQAALLGNQMVLSGGLISPGIGLSPRVEFVDISNWSSILDCNLSASFPDYFFRGANLNTTVIGDKVYFGSNESISVYNSTAKSWKYAKVESYNGLVYTFQGQLYSFRYDYSSMKYQVIRIVM